MTKIKLTVLTIVLLIVLNINLTPFIELARLTRTGYDATSAFCWLHLTENYDYSGNTIYIQPEICEGIEVR